MRRIGRSILVLAVASLLAVACGSESGNQPSAKAESATQSTTTATGQVSDEQADANAMLEAITADPSWMESVKPPVAALDHPVSTYAKQADATGFWTTDESTEDVQAWISAHPPDGFVEAASGELGGGELTGVKVVRFRPEEPVLEMPARAIAFSVAKYETGAAIRADAQVALTQQRPRTLGTNRPAAGEPAPK